ncbi:MAG: C1 family peptidase [Geminicoccaceae bacterium]
MSNVGTSKRAAVDSFQTNVVKDWTDLRDQVYRPSLLRLPSAFKPDGQLFQQTTAARVMVRNQGSEGSCTGQALASLVDILRLGQLPEGESVAPSSARMLFEMAKLQEPKRGRDEDEEVFSLRAAIKGFYHNGVCLDDDWPYVETDKKGELQVDRAKAARQISLGAYYRVEPILNHYHTAIAEVGAIYVAAHTHAGWTSEHVNKSQGRIDPSFVEDRGGHAFVIVGYDRDGFLVLNSWGSDWGGYQTEDGAPPLAGVAHWRYEDWADNICDAWVLRIGAPTPDAFDLTIGTQGLFAGSGPIGSTSTPRAELIGHYIHLDDGKHVVKGNYPSSPEGMRETFRYLRGKRGDGEEQGRDIVDPSEENGAYRDILIWLTGGIENTKEAFAHAARMKPTWVQNGVYPINVIWCTDFVEQARIVLEHLFDLSKEQVGKTGDELDRVIEGKLHGIGRAFWRDVKKSARNATDSGCSCTELFEEASSLCAENGKYRLHVVAEGAGAVLLGFLLERLAELPEAGDQDFRARLFEAIDTLSLVAPACTLAQFSDSYRGLIDHLQTADLDRSKNDREKRPKVALYVPSVALERRMRVGLYGKSMLHLVANGFEDRSKLNRWRERASGALRGPELVGMAPDSDSDTSAMIDADPDFAAVAIEEVGLRADLPDSVGQEEITRNPRVIDSVLDRIGRPE